MTTTDPSPTLAALRDLIASTPGRPGGELAAARVLLAAHARELANAQAHHVSAVNAIMLANRDRARVAYCAGMTEVVRGLRRYADDLDTQVTGGDR